MVARFLADVHSASYAPQVPHVVHENPLGALQNQGLSGFFFVCVLRAQRFPPEPHTGHVGTAVGIPLFNTGDAYMATNTLTDARCKAAKPSLKPVKMFDGGGLFLWVSPKGAKIWRIAYRLEGKQQQMSLGEYPSLTLADARQRRDEVRATLARGEDPAGPKKSARPAMTLEQANEGYWATRGDLSPSYLKKSKRAVEQYLYPRFRAAGLDEVSSADLLEVLRGIDAAGKAVYVRKVRLWVGMIYDCAIANGWAQASPAAQIDPKRAFSRAKVIAMPALELHEVHPLMRRLAMEKPLQSVLGCRLLALTWLRTGELRTMRWDDLQGDLLRIPGKRIKREKDHVVPLSRQALALVDELRLRRNGSEFVFPSDRRIDRPMSENAILYLLHRLGYKGKMMGHGWRSVASTWANENGHPADAIERQLAHSPTDKVRSAYNRAEYLQQRRAMLQEWADWLVVDDGWRGS